MMLLFGAILGATLRFYIYEYLKDKTASFIPTIIVNVVGSFCLGLYIHYGLHILYSFFVIGLLSSFTTFSTFSVDCLKLILEQKWGVSILYILANIVLCATALVVALII